MKHHAARRAYDYETRNKTRLVILVDPKDVAKLTDLAEDSDTTVSALLRKQIKKLILKAS
jgi:hypothetical protein